LRSVQVSPLEQARRGGPQAQPVKEMALRSAQQARDAPQEPRRAAVLVALERGALRAELQPEAVSACAAARPEAKLAPAHVAAEPLLEAATAASALQAAAWELDAPRAEEVALSGARVRQPVAARPEHAVVSPRAAVRSGVRELQAPASQVVPDARRAADPSEAASVFRQAPFLVSGPARPRAAAHFAHAMRSLPIASRSKP
jgi:hypothetical protein